MAEPTKIFISSVAQGSFKTLRNDLYKELTDAGHEPVMFEKNMTPWQQHAVDKCIETVKQCDMFLLFLAEKSGSKVEELGCTVTHYEFLTAYENRKQILVFADQEIKSTYFSVFHNRLDPFFTEFKVTNHRDPKPAEIENEVNKILNDNNGNGNLAGVDPYVWVFFADVVLNKYFYIDDLKSYGTINLTIKQSLSEILKNGVSYLAMEDLIVANQESTAIYVKYQKLVKDQIALLQNGLIYNWRAFLANLSYPLEGGRIYKEHGGITEVDLGEYNKCQIITLYKREENIMKLIEYHGPLNDFHSYDLDDPNSFVADVYHNEVTKLFFHPGKNVLYLAQKAGQYVLCYHYPLRGDLTMEKFTVFHQDIYDAIIKSESEIYRAFTTSLLGGLKNDE